MAPTPLFAFLICAFIWLLKFSFLSRMSPRCLCSNSDFITTPLNNKGGCTNGLVLVENTISIGGLDAGGELILKTIGVCHSQLLALGLGENARRAKIDTLGENMEVKLWKSIP